VVYRHPSPEKLRNSQIADAIAMELSHFRGPIFRMEEVHA
jgi:hypothetical protein